MWYFLALRFFRSYIGSYMRKVIGKFHDWRNANKLAKIIQLTSLTEAGMSDCYKLISSFFRVYFKRMPANIIKHRDYIKFSAESNPINWTKNLKFLAYKKATNPCNSLNKKKTKRFIWKRQQKTESRVVKCSEVHSHLSFYRKASFIMIIYQINWN